MDSTRKIFHVAWVLMIFSCFAGLAFAQGSQPHRFSANSPALAEQVNANFDHVDVRIADHINDSSVHSTTDNDTLGAMVCSIIGQVAKWDGSGWDCGNDADTVLTEAEVDAFVNNNGYLTTTAAASAYAPLGHNHDATYLTPATAAATYLTPADAAATYLTPAAAAATYLNSADASATYMSSVDASATYQEKANRTYVVSSSDTDLNNGAALLAAIAAITPTASAAAPALVQLEPGFYALGASILTVPSFVTLQGAGSRLTTITSTVLGPTYYSVSVNNEATLTNLAISSENPDYSLALHLKAGSQGRHLVVSASGGTQAQGVKGDNDFTLPTSYLADSEVYVTGTGWNIGLRNHFTAINVRVEVGGSGQSTGSHVSNLGNGSRGVRIFVNGTGQNVGASDSTIHNASIDVQGGTSNIGVRVLGVLAIVNTDIYAAGSDSKGIWLDSSGFVTVDRSTIEGVNHSIHAPAASSVGIIKVGMSKLIGPITNGNASTMTCIFSHDSSYVAFPSTCIP